MAEIREWGGFGGIMEEMLADEALDEDIGDEACPLCGEPLDINVAGVANCKLGHWRDWFHDLR